MKIIKISINSDDETDFSSQPLLDPTFLVDLVIVIVAVMKIVHLKTDPVICPIWLRAL